MSSVSWCAIAPRGYPQPRRRYFKFGPTAEYGHDQRMLGLMLRPLIRNRCLVHD